MQNIGRNLLEKASKEFENDFKLMNAQRQHLKQVYELKPVSAQKVQYGRTQIKGPLQMYWALLFPPIYMLRCRN
jgi:hypothetical protein